ncbi:3-oxoacyl-[acyl-carrier-protein] synthase III C-terminal domain-containing protein [Marinicrinis sediminis]|uniref:3-oxoacyl-[acyl-carrier-protein] synthase III C-terminal domain-containing protein n=1 Tax=Marinicrinis sediminis TaxID=1652465 RepID=A0ABW5RFS1_9BACL
MSRTQDIPVEDKSQHAYGIVDTACYVPAERIRLSDMQAELQISPSELHRLMDEHELDTIAVETKHNVVEMMEQAANELLTRHWKMADSIDCILYTHTFNPLAPFLYDPLARIQQRWPLSHVPVQALTQLNCASMDLLFSAARQRFERTEARSILLLAADKMYMPNSRYLQDSTVSADGAAAVLLSRQQPVNRLLASCVHAEASVYNSVRSSPERFAWFQQTFSFGLIKLLRRTAAQAQLDLSQLKWIFPANVNEGTWRRVSEGSQLPLERFYFPLLSRIGHAHNADPILNYQHALRKGVLQDGDYYATLSVGMGSTFGCSIFQHSHH